MREMQEDGGEELYQEPENCSVSTGIYAESKRRSDRGVQRNCLS